ncbi:MAG: DAK2 domain-containing protein [Firmicutes bacterium]|nr:DAK2 domain-containing protein [Bacillota bacterium]
MNLEFIEGPELKNLLAAGVECLNANKEEINDLNVFPVPDGDTGTNMVLTFQAALREVQQASDEVKDILERAARGSLMGARGNSGVIVSQFFRGFARAVGNAPRLGTLEIAKGIEGASKLAYQAIRKPVEGTILTIVREAAAKAQELQKKKLPLMDFLVQIYQHIVEVLEKTPEMLPILKQAGVVDAGGKGLCYFCQGFVEALKGENIRPLPKAEAPAPGLPAGVQSVVDYEIEDEHELDPDKIAYRYCTEFIIKGEKLAIEEIKKDLAPHGDSLIVIGDTQVAKVHIHTNNPGLVLDYMVRLGEMTAIQIDNMVEQSRERLAKLGMAANPAPAVKKKIGITAVVAGKGLQAIFRDLGADEIIEGGQTMNPSTEELYRAVSRIQAEQVIILPNNKNVIMAAGQVQALTETPVTVIPSRTIPQGISALMAYNAEAGIKKNREAMSKAIKSVITGEVTFAVRSSSFNGLEIREGDIIGLKEGDIISVGKNPSEVLLDLLKNFLKEKEDALITVYYGHDIEEKEANELEPMIQEAFPEAEVEIYEGGQPFYYYIVSVE